MSTSHTNISKLLDQPITDPIQPGDPNHFDFLKFVETWEIPPIADPSTLETGDFTPVIKPVDSVDVRICQSPIQTAAATTTKKLIAKGAERKVWLSTQQYKQLWTEQYKKQRQQQQQRRQEKQIKKQQQSMKLATIAPQLYLNQAQWFPQMLPLNQQFSLAKLQPFRMPVPQMQPRMSPKGNQSSDETQVITISDTSSDEMPLMQVSGLSEQHSQMQVSQQLQMYLTERISDGEIGTSDGTRQKINLISDLSVQRRQSQVSEAFDAFVPDANVPALHPESLDSDSDIEIPPYQIPKPSPQIQPAPKLQIPTSPLVDEIPADEPLTDRLLRKLANALTQDNNLVINELKDFYRQVKEKHGRYLGMLRNRLNLLQALKPNDPLVCSAYDRSLTEAATQIQQVLAYAETNHERLDDEMLDL